MNNPITRKEKLLKAIANGENPQISPITREEQYLSFIAGSGNSVPDNPITREEFYLDKIARQGTGGGGSGGGGEETTTTEDAVNFYDYDGTLLHSYPVEEVMAMEELPALPTQKGLICQGWNWTLDDIKSHNRAVDVGANYITDDGKTRLYIDIETESLLSVRLSLYGENGGKIIIDWGDGSELRTGFYSSADHTYSRVGEYVITIDVPDGSTLIFGKTTGLVFGDSSSGSQNTLLQKLELGKNTRFDKDGITNNWRLKSISVPTHITSNIHLGSNYLLTGVVIPNGVTSMSQNAFSGNRSLSAISIPNSVTSISQTAFQSCYSLSSIVIPNGVTSIGDYMFNTCYSLSSIVIPNGVTSIGNYAFSKCYQLENVVIPNSVTSIGNYAFEYCQALKNIIIPNSVTSIGNSIFSSCSSLSNVTIPSSVTSIGNKALSGTCILSFVVPSEMNTIPQYICQDCKQLINVVIHDNVTSIEDYAFQRCSALLYVVMPSSLTSIGSSAFDGCYDLAVCDFTKCTVVPTLANSQAFNIINLQIRVPASLYDEWIAATNWSSLASKIVAV